MGETIIVSISTSFSCPFFLTSLTSISSFTSSLSVEGFLYIGTLPISSSLKVDATLPRHLYLDLILSLPQQRPLAADLSAIAMTWYMDLTLLYLVKYKKNILEEGEIWSQISIWDLKSLDDVLPKRILHYRSTMTRIKSLSLKFLETRIQTGHKVPLGTLILVKSTKYSLEICFLGR